MDESHALLELSGPVVITSPADLDLERRLRTNSVIARLRESDVLQTPRADGLTESGQHVTVKYARSAAELVTGQTDYSLERLLEVFTNHFGVQESPQDLAKLLSHEKHWSTLWFHNGFTEVAREIMGMEREEFYPLLAEGTFSPGRHRMMGFVRNFGRKALFGLMGKVMPAYTNVSDLEVKEAEEAVREALIQEYSGELGPAFVYTNNRRHDILTAASEIFGDDLPEALLCDRLFTESAFRVIIDRHYEGKGAVVYDEGSVPGVDVYHILLDKYTLGERVVPMVKRLFWGTIGAPLAYARLKKEHDQQQLEFDGQVREQGKELAAAHEVERALSAQLAAQVAELQGNLARATAAAATAIERRKRVEAVTEGRFHDAANLVGGGLHTRTLLSAVPVLQLVDGLLRDGHYLHPESNPEEIQLLRERLFGDHVGTARFSHNSAAIEPNAGDAYDGLAILLGALEEEAIFTDRVRNALLSFIQGKSDLIDRIELNAGLMREWMNVRSLEERARVTLYDLFTSQATLLYPGKAEEANLVVDLPQDLAIMGDPERLRLLAANSLGNAFAASLEHPDPAVYVEGDFTDEGYSLRVRNTGSQVPERVLYTLNNTFDRVSTNARVAGRERGSGTLVIREAADYHGFSRRFTSPPEGGMELILGIPKKLIA